MTYWDREYKKEASWVKKKIVRPTWKGSQHRTNAKTITPGGGEGTEGQGGERRGGHQNQLYLKHLQHCQKLKFLHIHIYSDAIIERLVTLV